MEKLDMDEDSKSEEPFLKIERTWSEAEPNYENITVKEEDISDVEPETLLKELEENNCTYITPSDKSIQQNVETTKDSVEDIITSQGDGDPSEKGKPKGNDIDLKQTCLHDAKNFKVVKKRLRCSDCKSVLCPECYCTISSSLQTHFSKSDNNNKSLYPCKLCSMIFKANCALQAHIRIHLLDTPYVCPDCGAIYNNIYFLSLHLINKCYHVYKVVTNGCKFCLSQNMAPEEYIAHIEKIHIKPVYKCSQCGLMFENTTDMNRHLGSSHKNKSVLSLSYFCCSMCGNLIISKHLYAKHIKYHRDHSATFQIGYLCSCGHSFNTACSFRSHFKNCSKKGILPPQWTYLQVTLKTHEMLQVQSAMEKNVFLRSQSGFISNPGESKIGSAVEKRKMDYYLFEDGDSSEEFEESSEGSLMNSSNNVQEDTQVQEEEGKTERGTTISAAAGNVGSKKSEEEKRLNREGKFEKRVAATEGRNDSLEIDPSKSSQEDEQVLREPRTNSEEIIREELTIEEISQDSQGNSGVSELYGRERGNDNGDRDGDRALKVMYDHIPCDHLGYLKTQQSSDMQDKNVKKDGSETRNCDVSGNPLGTSPGNYIITSVLDEKTGVMRTRKMFIQKGHMEQVEEDGAVNAEVEEIQGQQSRKSRNGTFFCCPFCSVLFPKHFSSFHRFRLHLECYHPEAALDITVDRSQLPKSETPFSSIKMVENDLDSDDDLHDLDDVDLQTRLNSLKESNREEYSGNVHLQTSESSNDGSVTGEFTNRDKKKKGQSHTDIPGRQDLDTRLRSGKSIETESNEVVGIKPGKSSTKDACRKNLFTRKINDNFRATLSQSADNSIMSDYIEDNYESRAQKEHRLSSTSARSFEDIDENSESMDSEICSNYIRATKLNDCEDEFTTEGNETKSGSVLKGVASKSRRATDDFHPNDRGTGDLRNDQDFGADKEHQSKHDSIGTRSVHVNTSMGKEDDDEDFDAETPESRKEKQGRSAERRNSRRESDVWSEFYKTLKIAETLKKTKAKNQEKEGSEDISIITNYANKRVVKKPKRYRESSDSRDSNDGESSRLDPEEEELYMKKKKLLNRLENVDVRIVDYIFKILERKQRNLGSLKRNADSNVRSLNRRLVNGGKISSKQQRASLDHEEVGADEKEFSDYGEELEWDLQTGTFLEDKVDKRRGRPRKSDYLTLKERRRSDYDREVKLTEKNLDGDDDFYGKKKKRKLSSKLQYYKKIGGPCDNNDFSSGQVISTIKNSDPEKKLTCAVCKESHQTQAEFREHIQTHRMDDSSHQCMECGECFVVRPSLEKHLHAFHKIRDVQKYIEENECSTLEKVEEAESEPLKENQCRVCKDQFPTVHDLNKHFRIHGMAFLRQFKKDSKPN